MQPVAAGVPRDLPQRPSIRPQASQTVATPVPRQRPLRLPLIGRPEPGRSAPPRQPTVRTAPAGPPPPQGHSAPAQAAVADRTAIDGRGTDDAATATAFLDGPDQEAGSWALVEAAQTGDMAAFGELFDRYHDVVFRFVLFRMGDRTFAEDVTQETFVRALRRISSVSYQGRDIGAWFITIARNLIFDHVKSSRYRLEHSTGEIIELSPTTHGPEQQVLEGATNDELMRCVRKLNPDQQECITLRFLQGLSVAETAQIMDRNEGAVKALQHRAVRRLGQLLPEGVR